MSHSHDSRGPAVRGRTRGYYFARLGGQVSAAPMTYAGNGRQYVAIAAETSLFSFALKP
jgi:hypothetical protein